MQNNFADFIISHNSDKIAIIDDTQTLTYRQLGIYTRKFAKYLTDKGLSAGDRVVISMADSVEWVVGFLACVYIGVIPVVVSSQINRKKLQEITSVSKSKYMLQKDHVIIEKGLELDISYKFHDNEEALWLTSSGTTGKQKFIVHGYQSLPNYFHIIQSIFTVDDNSVIFSSPRLSFGYGLGVNIILGLGRHATIILTDKILSHKNLALKIMQYKISHFFSTPVFLSSLVKNNIKNMDAIRLLKVITSSGEPISLILKQKFKELYNQNILNGYGLSEVLSYVCVQRPFEIQDTDHRNIGKLFPLVSVEIRDSNNNVCSRNTVGELYIQHPCSAMYYYNDIQKTQDIFQTPWVKTNDLVYINNHDELIYVGRKDNLVKINGMYVSIDEVESAILEHDLIKECLVYTSLNNLNMLELEAKIISHNTLNAGDIRKYLKDKIESHKIPKRIWFTDTIAKTVTAKKIRNNIDTVFCNK
jgi:acyl-coenzyme A synthetase/AMP-(fatty) acid ligase